MLSPTQATERRPQSDLILVVMFRVYLPTPFARELST